MEELYKNYSKLIYHYLKGLCSNQEIAEELTQETFYRAIKGVTKFKGECKISSWLCQIAKNVWIDYRKKEGKIKLISLDDENDIEALLVEKSIEDTIENREQIVKLYKKIHQLDKETREVFYLRIKGELSFKEIASCNK